MARKTRVEFEGALYRVLDRGDRREAIFKDDGDRERFLGTLGEACARTGWRIHAWVLMSDHYHLLIETPEPNLVDGMQWLQEHLHPAFRRAAPAQCRLALLPPPLVSLEFRSRQVTRGFSAIRSLAGFADSGRRGDLLLDTTLPPDSGRA